MKTLLGQLIAAAPTVENGELRAAEILKAYFECHGLTAELDIWDGNRANLLVHLKADTPTGAPLLAASHLDVVPAAAGWTTAPFAMAERDGRLYGRGTTDMLGAVAAIAAALVETEKEKPPLPRDIVFASAAGEETDSCGAKRLVSQLKERFGAVSGVLIPEPTDLKVLRAHRGILWLKIAAHGRTAHGSMPHLGINAILKINTLLNRLRDFTLPQPPHPLLGGCSMSVNRIAGGSGTNIVPEHCAIEIDIRTLPGQSAEATTALFETLLAESAKDDPAYKADISELRCVPSLETPANEPFVRAVCQAVGASQTGSVGFTTDGPYFAPLGPVVIVGPGNPAQCHKPDEYIEIAALEQAKEMFKKIFQNTED